MTDREWDKRLRIKTTGREDESDANCSPYEPTPYAVLERLAERGHIRRRHRLIDYGCGKGRVAFFMASEVGCQVVGVDYSQKLIDIARENRRQCRGGDRVRLVCERAERYAVTDEDAFFFFNPFSEKIFEAVLRQIAKSYHVSPRPLTLCCYYPSEGYIQCLEDSGLFRLIDDIGCGDLFNGKNPREHLVVYGASV